MKASGLRALGDPETLRLAVHLAGIVAYDAGDFSRAEALLTECLALSRAMNATQDTGQCLYHLSFIVWGQGDERRAIALLEESFALHQADGDVVHAAFTKGALGLISATLGDYARGAVAP